LLKSGVTCCTTSGLLAGGQAKLPLKAGHFGFGPSMKFTFVRSPRPVCVPISSLTLDEPKRNALE